jgi:hypothetical protein
MRPVRGNAPSATRLLGADSIRAAGDGIAWDTSVRCDAKTMGALRTMPSYVDIHKNDQLDEELVASRIRQASELPAWVP